MPHFIVEEIEFDFDDEGFGYDPLTKEEEKSIIDQTLGVWHVEEESELVDKITTLWVGALSLLNMFRINPTD